MEELRRSIEELISLYEKERQKSNELLVKLSACQAELQGKKSEVAQLKEKLKAKELAGAFAKADSRDSFDAKASIDRLVRQINQCIDLLKS